MIVLQCPQLAVTRDINQGSGRTLVISQTALPIEFAYDLVYPLWNLYGTFLQQLECGYGFPALIHVWIASAGVLEWFISTSGFATSACKPF